MYLVQMIAGRYGRAKNSMAGFIGPLMGPLQTSKLRPPSYGMAISSEIAKVLFV